MFLLCFIYLFIYPSSPHPENFIPLLQEQWSLYLKSIRTDRLFTRIYSQDV